MTDGPSSPGGKLRSKLGVLRFQGFQSVAQRRQRFSDLRLGEPWSYVLRAVPVERREVQLQDSLGLAPVAGISHQPRQSGVRFERHDDRYARTEEWLAVVDGAWSQPGFSFKGDFYEVEECVLAPRPGRRPTIYAGGESEAAKSLIARRCDAYVMHGDPPERVAPKIADMRRRRDALGLPPMQYGLAGYVIVRETAEAVSVDEGFFAGPYVLPEKVVSRAKAWMTPEQHETLVRFRDEQTAQNDLFAANAKAMEEGLVRKPRIIE